MDKYITCVDIGFEYMTLFWRKHPHTFWSVTSNYYYFPWTNGSLVQVWTQQTPKIWRKTGSLHVVTSSVVAAQRFCCSSPMIRWLVHPEDVRAFSCGVKAACACLSCGRRWLRVGGGCCQMMAPGGAVREIKVGGEMGGGGRNKELRKEEEDWSFYTTNSTPFPLQIVVLQMLVI